MKIETCCAIVFDGHCARCGKVKVTTIWVHGGEHGSQVPGGSVVGMLWNVSQITLFYRVIFCVIVVVHDTLPRVGGCDAYFETAPD